MRRKGCCCVERLQTPPPPPTRPPRLARPPRSLQLVLPEDGDLQRAAQELVAACKLLHPQRAGEVAALLGQAAQRQREAAEGAAAGPASQASAQPGGGAADAPQRVTEQDREALRRQQQQYLAVAAASTTHALAAAAATASLERLDEYLVGAAAAAAGPAERHMPHSCPAAARLQAKRRPAAGHPDKHPPKAALCPGLQEALYEEDLGAKAAAAAAVAQLCREPGGLEALMEHPALLQVREGLAIFLAVQPLPCRCSGACRARDGQCSMHAALP